MRPMAPQKGFKGLKKGDRCRWPTIATMHLVKELRNKVMSMIMVQGRPHSPPARSSGRVWLTGDSEMTDEFFSPLLPKGAKLFF